jgi:hypothetical protein
LSSEDLVSIPAYLTLEEVVARYRGQVSEGTLRDWRAMHIGPSFIKIGKGGPLSRQRARSLGQIQSGDLQILPVFVIGGVSPGRASSITMPGCSRHEQCDMTRFTMRNP